MKLSIVKFIRLFLLVSFLSLPVSIWAQVPEGYYDSAQSLSGEELKQALHEIIKNHIAFPYTAKGTDVWAILKETDRDTSNSENVILFYSGWSVNAAQEYNNGNGWTREQVWAMSHGGFSTSKGAGTDVHHIRPADHSVNSARGNKDFDWGGNLYVDGDGPTECYSDADSWEPRDAVKGDIARMLFYMAVRYEGENGELDLELADEINTADLTEPGKGFHGKLSTLLEWNESDGVDSFEIRRNEVIYSYQNNRNPFIDNPEFADKIWRVTGIDEFEVRPFKVFPNPAKDFVCIEWFRNHPAQGAMFSTDGRIVTYFLVSGTIRLVIPDMSPGVYFLKIKTSDTIFTEKVIVAN